MCFFGRDEIYLDSVVYSGDFLYIVIKSKFGKIYEIGNIFFVVFFCWVLLVVLVKRNNLVYFVLINSILFMTSVLINLF